MNPTSEARFADRRFAWLSEPLPPVTVSFELFPAKTPAAADKLWQTVE
jgi:hypothetical protein